MTDNQRTPTLPHPTKPLLPTHLKNTSAWVYSVQVKHWSYLWHPLWSTCRLYTNFVITQWALCLYRHLHTWLLFCDLAVGNLHYNYGFTTNLKWTSNNYNRKDYSAFTRCLCLFSCLQQSVIEALGDSWKNWGISRQFFQLSRIFPASRIVLAACLWSSVTFITWIWSRRKYCCYFKKCCLVTVINKMTSLELNNYLAVAATSQVMKVLGRLACILQTGQIWKWIMDWYGLIVAAAQWGSSSKKFAFKEMSLNTSIMSWITDSLRDQTG